jgi:hypothetical protein
MRHTALQGHLGPEDVLHGTAEMAGLQHRRRVEICLPLTLLVAVIPSHRPPVMSLCSRSRCVGGEFALIG